MTAPRWTRVLLRRLAPPGGADDVLGDLEEAHRGRVRSRGRLIASVLTALDALDMAVALIFRRIRRGSAAHQSTGSDVGSAGDGRSGWGISWLDVKLGFRMLVRYPGLTLVGGLAMAFAIAIGAVVFEFVTILVHPSLPLDDGDRIVGIRNWDVAASREDPRALHDFVTWREELESIEDLGAFHTLQRNLVTGEGAPEPVIVTAISASAFRVARVPPLLGRSLIEADEQAGAPMVVVIGYGLWQTRFGGDPEVVGRTVRLGTEQTTVVGVMPEGFEFPVSDNLWLPLRLNVLDYERGQGPAIRVFGRLAPGVTLDEAQAELTTIVSHAATAFPDADEHLQSQVMLYPLLILDTSGMISLGSITLSQSLERGLMYSINAFYLMFLVLVCGNVALLMFARAATRENEIAVRNALGATRSRIVAQLFAEALVLGGVAAVVGLAAAGFVLKWGLVVADGNLTEGGRLPFWFDDSLAPATVLYAGGLTVLGAVIAGVVPALKLTRGLEARLRQAAVGEPGQRFGGL